MGLERVFDKSHESCHPRLLFGLCFLAYMNAVFAETTTSSNPTAFSKDFKLDLDEEEAESGERLQLHSRGILAESIDLDTLPEVKRVACVGNRLLIAMTDDSPAHDWQAGQLVVGGTKWGCNATFQGAPATKIYVKIARVLFPVEGRPDVSATDMVTIHHVPAGPLDMLKEASIFFRFQPTTSEASQSANHRERHERFRRSLYNLVSNMVDDVNWQANFSTRIPFDIGVDSNNTRIDKIAVHKSWGQTNLSVSREQTVVDAVVDDFILLLGRLSGMNRLAYTFDLLIKNVDGTPQIMRYISQFDVNCDLSTDATVIFTREMGLTKNTTIWESPSSELFRMPVAQTLGLPPIYLVVSVQSSVHASVHAYSSGTASLRTAYNASGFLTLSQQFDPTLLKASDFTSREWTVQALDQRLTTTHLIEVDISLYQTLHFQSAISWHYHDVDMELAPPSQMTIRPQLTIKSNSSNGKQCLNSFVTLDASGSASESRFTVQAFGLKIWDVPLQPAMSRSLHVLDQHLEQACLVGQCFGESQLLKVMSRKSSGTVIRGDETFSSFTALSGNMIRFVDSFDSAIWCGQPGMPCYSCKSHTYATPTTVACASRLVSSRLASALTQLAKMVVTEWPDRQLLVLRAWDEATSQNPNGVYPSDSLFKEGRAASLGLCSSNSDLSQAPVTLILSNADLQRLGQLAVCSGLEIVQFTPGQNGVEVGVEENGFHAKEQQLGNEETQTRLVFWETFFKLDVATLYPLCLASAGVQMNLCNIKVVDFNLYGSFESACGPSEKPLDRTDYNQIDSILEFSFDNGSVTFEPEGAQSSWCGAKTRNCSSCLSPSRTKEPWDWCSSRMMTPRLALAFGRLQKLAKQAGFGIHVLKGFSEPTEANPENTLDIFNEGRALTLNVQSPGNADTLAKLARCAGFDFVDQSTSGDVSVCVQNQHGYWAHSVSFFEGPAYFVASLKQAPAHLALEYETPTVNLTVQIDLPYLVDGRNLLDTFLSEHVQLRHVISRNSRYFRLDELLLNCIEMVIDDFNGNVEIITNSAFRTRAANFLDNLDTRHVEERWRHMMGQAVRLRPVSSVNSTSLQALATSILRECPSLVQANLKAVGLGCHDDYVYVDIRPVEEGKEYEYIKVWNSGTSYCGSIILLQRSLLAGGPVIRSDACVNCRDRGLDPELEFLRFQFGQEGQCQTAGQAEFCQLSQSSREAAANDLQELLTSAAGNGRLPRFEIIQDIRACLVDNCGGCAGEGPVFDAKVRACSRVVHKYLERSATPFPDLTNVTTFFNTDTAQSSVHGEACKSGRVCVEETIIYSLLVPTVTRRFFPNPAHSIEKELFGSINPTPLLELAAQEFAYRASGLVAIYIESERDTYALRNVLQVLFTYNKRVTLVEIHVSPDADVELVTTSIQRKLTTWAGAACPKNSRFAIAPFRILKMDQERKKRSVENSKGRNIAKDKLYNWEREWIDKMF